MKKKVVVNTARLQLLKDKVSTLSVNDAEMIQGGASAPLVCVPGTNLVCGSGYLCTNVPSCFNITVVNCFSNLGPCGSQICNTNDCGSLNCGPSLSQCG